MTDTTQSKGFIKGSAEVDADLSHWALPDVSQAVVQADSNAFGYQPNKAKEALEEIVPILPPTLAEIEEIRAQAEQEGLEDGRKAGFSEGLEKGRLEGLEQGHNEGFEQGQQQGLEKGLAQAAEMVEKFEGLLEQFKLPLTIVDIDVEQELLTIVGALSKSLIGHELKTHPEHIVAAIRIAVDALPIKEQKISIRLHPDDVAIVEVLYSQAQLERNLWQLDADPSLVRGDCVIDSAKSKVDMRLETRLEQVFEHLDKQQDHLRQQKFQQEQLLAEHKQTIKSQASDTVNNQHVVDASSTQSEQVEPQIDTKTSSTGSIGEPDADPSTPTA